MNPAFILQALALLPQLIGAVKEATKSQPKEKRKGKKKKVTVAYVDQNDDQKA